MPFLPLTLRALFMVVGRADAQVCIEISGIYCAHAVYTESACWRMRFILPFVPLCPFISEGGALNLLGSRLLFGLLRFISFPVVPLHSALTCKCWKGLLGIQAQGELRIRHPRFPSFQAQAELPSRRLRAPRLRPCCALENSPFLLSVFSSKESKAGFPKNIFKG
jgi:hypothetical protein